MNPDFLSLTTPSYFDFSRHYSFKQVLEKGVALARSQRLVICGLIRDRQDKVQKIRERIRELRKYFKSVKILIVENDSEDDTRKELLNWAHSDPDLEVLGCDINASKCSLRLPKTEGHAVPPSRLIKMAMLRNIYRDRIEEAYSDYDTVLVWDMDVTGSLYIDGLLNGLEALTNQGKEINKPEERSHGADGICANGLYVWPGINLYYDTFAHKQHNQKWLEIFPKNIQDVVKAMSRSTKILQSRTQKVSSCFSGATLYRLSSFLKNRYSTDGKECEHTSISKGLNMYINNEMVNYILLNE
jgi:hypothetical protein